MPVIQHLLARLGFVKLTRYGLVLTPEGRIVSTRAQVLDDGTGGPIVGWEDADPVAGGLPSWTAGRALASGSVLRSTVSAPVAAAMFAAPTSVSEVVSVSSIDSHATVAPDPVVDEDDWEWTIALARARAEEPVEAAPPAPGPPAPVERVRTRPMATISTDPAASADWPLTLPVGAIDYEDYVVVSSPAPVVSIPRARLPQAPSAASAPRPVTPSTVIPVPALPTMHGTAFANRLEPVVRSASRTAVIGAMAAPTPTPPARFSKGTVSERSAVREPPDDTQPSLAIGDRTQPGIALPPAARAVQLPSIKRRTSLSR
jgi:hypothetical protein